MTQPREFEWPTILLLVVTYAVWAGGTLFWPVSGVLSVLITAVAIAQFSSLQHEVLHGHPFRAQVVNDALGFPALSVYVPYLRFKDTHLQHHYDPNLTDPYDDPESNYMDPAVWERLSRPMQRLMRVNNTLLGRMILGPAIGTWFFCKSDWAQVRAGNARIITSWVMHGLGLVLVLWWLWAATEMPIWAYLVAAYLGYSLLKIRTYLEHRAHTLFRARTVIVEGKGPLAWLYLFNSLHVVHHTHPREPWYKMPAMYAARADHYRRRNEAYVYPGYAAIFREFLFKAKDPVPHPVWPVRKSEPNDADPA